MSIALAVVMAAFVTMVILTLVVFSVISTYLRMWLWSETDVKRVYYMKVSRGPASIGTPNLSTRRPVNYRSIKLSLRHLVHPP